MALHFSANQYDRNFQPKLLQNWAVPKLHRERPRAFVGFTQIVANDRGHLLQGVKRSRESPWGPFVGTYDMPTRIPGNSMMNCTARTENAMMRLQRLKTDGDIILEGRLKKCNVPSPLPVKADVQADKTVSPKETRGATDLAGTRSGAQAPEPKSSADVPPSPQVRTPVKPVTPNLDWPKPSSAGGRVKSASPKLETPKPLPPIASPKPVSPVEQAQKQDINWPSPKPADPQPA